MHNILPASTPAQLEDARTLMREYVSSLSFSMDFQCFEREMASLPGRYAPPGGVILLLYIDGCPVGCVALRPLAEGICEMKRMYVAPGHRGFGHGRALAEAVLSSARSLGYHTMRLDSVRHLTVGLKLYAKLGFREIPPYCHNPEPDAVYMEKDLSL